jgi:hypothetical protein
MADNDRVQWDINDLGYGQLAASQASRTNFTPGKASTDAGGMNWETDFRIPVGVPALEANGPLQVTRMRTSLTRRNIVSNQVIGNPVSSGTKVTTITDTGEWGATSPVSTLTETNTQDLGGRNGDVVEKTSGYDWGEGA